jgi:hypothetical protein
MTFTLNFVFVQWPSTDTSQDTQWRTWYRWYRKLGITYQYNDEQGRVKSRNMTAVLNAGYRCIFPVCFRHTVVSIWPWSRCVVMSFVRRTGLSDDVCSSYELLFVFVLIKVLESFSSYASPQFTVSDFNSTIIQILVLVTAMYLVFHVCDFTTWYSYSLWLNSSMASS